MVDKKKVKEFHLIVPREMHKHYKELAKERGVAVTAYVRFLLLQHMKTPLKLSFDKVAS